MTSGSPAETLRERSETIGIHHDGIQRLTTLELAHSL
jgi:hypothetical protein